MGLEFQSRGFVRVDPSDQFLPNPDTQWATTGRKRNFYHYCQEIKWSSFDAAREVFEKVSTVQHSTGFFSLQEDFLDCSPRSRAYILNGGRFREVNTRDIQSKEENPPGIYQHFEWCRHCFWPHPSRGFPALSKPFDFGKPSRGLVDVAGWFFIRDENPDFPSLIKLFSNPEVATIKQSSGRADHYLFVGEQIVALDDVVGPLIRASDRFPLGTGMLFILSESSLEQFAIAGGEARVLAPIEFGKLKYHDDVQFATGRFGYEPR